MPQIIGSVILYSRIKEVAYEIEYGEKKLIAPFMTAELMAEMRDHMERSGTNTPVPFGMQRPLNYQSYQGGQSYA